MSPEFHYIDRDPYQYFEVFLFADRFVLKAVIHLTSHFRLLLANSRH